MIQFVNVNYKIGSLIILDQVSFSIERGERIFLLGKSGTGKSMLLKNITGFVQPQSGDIFIDNERIQDASATKLYEIRKKCGIVLQHPALFDFLNVFQNITFGIRHEKKIVQKKIAEKMIHLVHLPRDIFKKNPNQLSFGMQKRVSIARTLALDPSILLFDEPTTGLDPITTEIIHELILELTTQLSITSLVVSHDIQSALRYATRIFFLDQGILTTNTVQEFIEHPHPIIQEFLGNMA